MRAIDTNILVRIIVNDDQTQHKKAADLLLKREDIFLCDTVLLEAEWVLRSVYEIDRFSISEAFKRLLGLSFIHTKSIDVIYPAIRLYDAGLDFGDAIHLANSEHCSSFITFDRKFVSRAKNRTRIKVELL